MRKTLANIFKNGIQMAASYMVASVCIHGVKALIGIGCYTPEPESSEMDEEFDPDLVKRAVQKGVRESIKGQGISEVAVDME